MSFILIFIGIFLVSCGYGVMMSLSLFVTFLGGSEEVAGILLGISGVGTITAVLLSKWLLHHIHGKYLALLGALCFLVGLCILAAVQEISWLLGLAVILTGAGWGFSFNASPYMLSLLTNNHNRSIFFNYLAAVIVLGTGLAPICIHWRFPLSIHFATVYHSAVICVALALVFFAVLSPHKIVDGARHLPHPQRVFVRVIHSPIVYPLVMTFLSACIFTMMMNYQMTYAKKWHLNYADFYMAYCSAVVLARLLFGKLLARFCQYNLAIVLSVMLIFSLLAFLWADSGQTIYFAASAFLGVSYGLLYPTLQAMCVNLADPCDRKDVISYFSLSYFFAVFAFPILGGAIIVHWGYHVLLWVLIFIMVLELILGLLLKRLIYTAK